MPDRSVLLPRGLRWDETLRVLAVAAEHVGARVEVPSAAAVGPTQALRIVSTRGSVEATIAGPLLRLRWADGDRWARTAGPTLLRTLDDLLAEP